MTNRTSPHLLTVGEVAVMCGVAPQTVWRWCRDGYLPYIQATPTSQRRFRPEDVARLLKPQGGAEAVS